jgi:hypothetical protein
MYKSREPAERRRKAREEYNRLRNEAAPEVRELWRQKQREANAASYAKHRAKRLKRIRKYRAENKAKMDAYFREYRERNRERLRASQAKRRQEHRDEINAYNREYRKTHEAQYRAYKRSASQRIKREARLIVRLAVSAGLIRKPEHCEGCGETFPARRLQGHHYDGYDRPLDVRWLCATCHGKAHQKE